MKYFIILSMIFSMACFKIEIPTKPSNEVKITEKRVPYQHQIHPYRVHIRGNVKHAQRG